jgi:hypothetical protein
MNRRAKSSRLSRVCPNQTPEQLGGYVASAQNCLRGSGWRAEHILGFSPRPNPMIDTDITEHIPSKHYHQGENCVQRVCIQVLSA